MLRKKKYYTKDLVGIIFSYAPLEGIITALKYVVDGIVPTLEILAVAQFIDSAINIFSNKQQISTIVLPVIFMVILKAYEWMSMQVSSLVKVRITNKLRENLRCDMTEEVAMLNYYHIENQESWDLISRVMKEPEIQCTDGYMVLLAIISTFVKVIGILIVLFTKVWWSPYIILSVSIPLFLLSLKSGKQIYDVSRNVEKNKRKAVYLEEVLNGRESVEERSLFGYCNKLNSKWFTQYEKARKEEVKVNAKWFIRMKLGGIIIVILSILIALILLFPVYQGLMSVGIFMSVVNSVFNLINELAWELPEYGDKIAKIKEYLVDLTNFILLDGKEDYLVKPSEKPIEVQSIEFKNVSFKYPGMESNILNDMSFKIEQGKHYAFVGTNGAGKTTVTKLLTGLYENFQGDILINGKSIKSYTQSELKAMFSVVYQDFARYYITIKENVLLGNINDFSNTAKVLEALDTMELKEVVEQLPCGIESSLGKISENGIDLSGGQWQRLAIARGIVSPNSIRILDEPTAALDPISESNIYEKFEEISRGKTTIFISHRLGSTKLADEIFVLEHGKIIEKGSFNELMDLNGIYASMYDSQRSWYK